jgi:protein-S-isoprenylcysteine O-methyltransferase Ste14
MTATTLLMALWVIWLASWLVAGLFSSPAATRPPLRQETLYRALTVGGVLLIFWPREGGSLWIGGMAADIPLLLLTLAGFAFAWWARLHLGRLWSGSVTRKADHRIIDSGPYGMVRHPIYTGILLALYATALQRGTIFALAGAAIATLAFYIKARLEERFLGSELGAAAYEAYRRRVPMLVPFLPRRR